jgi:predicted PurR-regulated permease PerM
MSTPPSEIFFEPRRFSKWVKIGVPLVSFGIFWILYSEAPLLFSSLILSTGLYYLLNPLVDYLESHSLKRGVASLLVLLALGLVFYLVWLRFVSFSADLKNQVDPAAFQRNLLTRVESAVLWAERKAPMLKSYLHPENAAETRTRARKPLSQEEAARVESQKVRTLIEEKFKLLTQKFFVEEAPDLARKIVALLPNLILIPYFTFFLLKDGRLFKKTIIEWIPNRYFEPSLKFFFEMSRKMRAYLQSLMIDCFLVGVIVGTGSAIVGAPYPIVFGVVAFILNSIPLLGPLVYGAICILITVAAGKPGDVVLGMTAVFVLSRLLDDLVLIPLIYGKSHHLHPVLVVCAVLLGESLAGVWGMFLAIPVASILLLGLGILREISKGERTPPLPASAGWPFA